MGLGDSGRACGASRLHSGVSEARRYTVQSAWDGLKGRFPLVRAGGSLGLMLIHFYPSAYP